jgi:hypothetical protein
VRLGGAIIEGLTAISMPDGLPDPGRIYIKGYISFDIYP